MLKNVSTISYCALQAECSTFWSPASTWKTNVFVVSMVATRDLGTSLL